jgi:uncharacterized membrane protein YdfJ with MMPL/SSD domain
MIAVFSGFILDDAVVIKSIGFALAFGVLIDAFCQDDARSRGPRPARSPR